MVLLTARAPLPYFDTKIFTTKDLSPDIGFSCYGPCLAGRAIGQKWAYLYSTLLEDIYGDGYRFTNQLVVRFLLTRGEHVSFLGAGFAV